MSKRERWTTKKLKNLIKKLLIEGEDLAQLTKKYKLTPEEALFVMKLILLEPEKHLDFILDEIYDRKDAEIKIYKQKVAELSKKLAHYDMIIDQLMAHVKAFKPPKYESLRKTTYTNGHKKEHPVLVVSDAHIGEVVNLDFYRYNVEKARTVARQIVLKTFEAISRRTYKNILTVFILGDMVSGIIHEELMRNTIVPVEQIIEAGRIMGWMLNELSRHIQQINVFAIIGNHGRIFKKVYFKDKYNNLDYLAYKFAEAYTKENKRISWFIPQQPFTIVNVEGFNFLLHHGDNIRSWAGIPYYGINRADNNYVASILKHKNIQVHYFVRGHFHSTMTAAAPLGMTFVNGAWKATDEYAFEGGPYKTTPVQLLLSVQKGSGVTSVDYLYLN